jgi:hypothetical protein
MYKAIYTLAALLLSASFSTAAAQQSASFVVTPSALNATVSFSLGDPFSATGGVFYAYAGDAGILASLDLTTAVPLAETVPIGCRPTSG